MRIGTYRDGVKRKETRLGWDYNNHIVCMCIIMKWSRNFSVQLAKQFWDKAIGCCLQTRKFVYKFPITDLVKLQSHGMYSFLFIELHISHYNVLPEAFVVVYL